MQYYFSDNKDIGLKEIYCIQVSKKLRHRNKLSACGTTPSKLKKNSMIHHRRMGWSFG
jgi:hypothetical protein